MVTARWRLSEYHLKILNDQRTQKRSADVVSGVTPCNKHLISAHPQFNVGLPRRHLVGLLVTVQKTGLC